MDGYRSASNSLIRIPLSELQEEDFAPLFRNSLIMAMLIVAGGWLFIRLQNRPLIALEKAAQGLGAVTFRRHCQCKVHKRFAR